MKALYLNIILFMFYTGFCYSQNLSGYIVDSENKPVDFATIIIQQIDSTFISASTSDTLGYFKFENKPKENIRLMIQHINFNPSEFIINVDTDKLDTIMLTPKNSVLSEAIVVAKRPHVYIKDGALSYDSKQISNIKAVSNAFDIIKETPGVIGDASSIELIGANRVNVIINSNPTSMSSEQIYGMLKSIPASRVKNVEIMYNSPARYNVNGAIINVILDDDNQDNKNNIEGEFGAEYRKEYYSSGLIRGNI